MCRPLGERYGDGPSVGYELLFGQVTRAQGIFSPRSNNVQFALDYVAENLDCPSTVLHYPSRRELVRELCKGYDVVGISFVLATFHRMKEVAALVRRHSPGSTIVLGGYGTVLGDDVLRPHGDVVCREDGVAFMRRLLGQHEVAMPYRHPLVVSRMRVFGAEASRTGMIFAGLGCPNGCDFCCTSHFFRRRHVRLLPTGRDVHDVMMRYVADDPDVALAIFDEDFLLDRRRALELRDAVLEQGTPLSTFAFASVRALSRFTVQEILEMGIDGVWIGYEGARAGYAKQRGRPFGELVRELQGHGITVLASMIVGLPYQTPAIIDQELAELLAAEPALCQFLIYGPTPGTPFFERVIAEGLLHDELARDPESYYRSCTGFRAMVRHPAMSAAEIEAAQERCFARDFGLLGPAIYRSIDVWLRGYVTLRESGSAYLRRKAERLARNIRKAYPVFRVGELFGPTREARRRVARLRERVHATLGSPTGGEVARSLLSVPLAAWTGVCLRLGFCQHPRLIRNERSGRIGVRSRALPVLEPCATDI
ncbi:MAG: hypothetical protein U0166_09610 [Acidobacteriota bacterium]